MGVQNEEKGTGAAHHNEFFDLDEDVFKLGVTGALSYALNFLDSDVDTTPRKWPGTVREMFLDSGTSPEEIEGYYRTIRGE